MANPFAFLESVRGEAQKVTWPSRRETMVSTGMVLLMVAISSLFFVLADQIIRFVLGLLFSISLHS